MDPTDLLDSLTDAEAASWSSFVTADGTVHLTSPRYYADGDAIELTVKGRGTEVIVTDAGEIRARLEMAGANLDAGRLAESWRALIRAHHVEERRGRVVARGPAAEAPTLIRVMLDAAASLDGLRVVVPAPRRPQFADELVTFFGAEFPRVEARPELRGESGTHYHLTAAVGSRDRMVYVQAISGGLADARRSSVEHAYTVFSDVNGTLPTELKLAVFSGHADEWKAAQLRLIEKVAYLGTWQSRDRLVSFVAGELPGQRQMLTKDEQLELQTEAP